VRFARPRAVLFMCMTFLRTKRVKKNGKTYEYSYWQKSVRVGRHVKSVHVGKSGDGNCHAAMLLTEENMVANQQALAEGRFVTEADPGGKENAPASSEGDASK
jgi:hypothetical protein